MRLRLCGCALKMSVSIIVCSLLVISTTFQFVHHLDYFSCQSWITQLIRVIQLIQLIRAVRVVQVKQVKSVSFNDSITVCSLFVISTTFDVKVGLISNQALFRKKENLSSQSFLSGLNYISVGQVSKISAQKFSRKYILLFIRTIKTASYLFLRFFCCVFRKCVCAAAEFVWICFDETFSWRVGMQMSLSASCDEGRYKDQLSFKTNSTNTNENTNRNIDAERVWKLTIMFSTFGIGTELG